MNLFYTDYAKDNFFEVKLNLLSENFKQQKKLNRAFWFKYRQNLHL